MHLWPQQLLVAWVVVHLWIFQVDQSQNYSDFAFDEFSLENPDEFKIIVLDNGAFHKAASLIIPNNIALLFLPPYSPELNPAEKIWSDLKRKFTQQLFYNLEQVSEFITNAIKTIDNKQVISTCSFKYIFSDIYWTT